MLLVHSFDVNERFQLQELTAITNTTSLYVSSIQVTIMNLANSALPNDTKVILNEKYNTFRRRIDNFVVKVRCVESVFTHNIHSVTISKRQHIVGGDKSVE
jgi:hypothetical protein